MTIHLKTSGEVGGTLGEGGPFTSPGATLAAGAGDAFGWTVEHWPLIAAGVVLWATAALAVVAVAGKNLLEDELAAVYSGPWSA